MSSRSRSQDLPEGGVDLGVVEVKTRLLGHFGDHLL